jgi:GAF domain-containing protein
MQVIDINSQQDKESIYKQLLPQLHALVEGEADMIANISNLLAAIHHTFNHHWTGVYFVKQNQLVLGPFQGPVACTRIAYGKGVCGTSWQKAETIIVPDVHQFEGHIACSALSNSEIVVPIIRNNEVCAILDVDSVDFGTFDSVDQYFLEQVAGLISRFL